MSVVQYPESPVPSIMEISYSTVQGGQASVSLNGNCDLQWGPGNTDIDPCFADPGYWDPNGTPDDPNDDFFVAGTIT